MKKLKNLFLFIAMVCVCILPNITNTNQNNNNSASAFIRKNFVSWDMERKLIYAYQNNLEIVSEGTGTTVYLVKSASEKVSLFDLYLSNQSSYAGVPPEDGANLSDWSIVFGAENYKEAQESNESVSNITMTGGKIKNVYAGHSVLDNQTNNWLRGTNIFTITGGEVDKLFTEHGYEEAGVATKANASNNTIFNLYGGKVNKLERTRVSANGEFKAKINIKGNVEIVESILYTNSKSGKSITISGAIDVGTIIPITLSDDFAKNDIIFNIEQSIASNFDASAFDIQNKPEASASWQYFVLENKVYFGLNQKITSANYVGQAKVGETLTIEITPEDASVLGVIWYRENAYIGGDSVIGDGVSYTLKPEDGGKKVYAEVYDKLQTQPIRVDIEDLIERIDLPEIIINNGQVIIYANGNDLLVANDGTGSTVYLDEGAIGVLDITDKSLKDLNIENALIDGEDLSNVIISAGSSNDKNVGDFAITIVGGNIKKIISTSTNGKKITEGVVVNLFGGSVQNVEISKTDVKINAIVNISGNINATINGIQNNNGATAINVIGEITSEEKSIKIIIDENLINDENILNSLQTIDLSKFDILNLEKNHISTFKLTNTNTGVKLQEISIESAEIKGDLKIGKTLTAKINPQNANTTYKWYRNTEKSLEGATLIEGENASTYTITNNDIDFYIILVVSDNDDSITVYSNKKVIEDKKINNALVIIICLLAGVVVALVLACVVIFKRKKQIKN